MKYHFSKTILGIFENTIKKVTEALNFEGFGILTEIDIKFSVPAILRLHTRHCL